METAIDSAAGRARLAHLAVRQSEISAEERPHLPGQTQQRGRVSAVRRQAQLEHAQALGLLDEGVLEARQLECLAELLFARERDELGQPVQGQPHQSCPSTRRSPSKRWRRWGMSKRPMAVRSMPMPKAKP